MNEESSRADVRGSEVCICFEREAIIELGAMESGGQRA